MELWVGFDVERFAAQAQAFIEARIERNVLATVTAAVRSGRYQEAIFAVITDAEAVVAVAVRTPPHRMLAAGTITEADAFVQAWLGIDPDCPGVSAESGLARSLTAAWEAETGGVSEVAVAEALHVLETVRAPDPLAPGQLCLADWREAAQLSDWGVAFAADTQMEDPAPAKAAIEHSLAQRRLYVWQRDGQSVAMVGHTVEVAGTVRVGPVYTPPQCRGRGYASAATAAVSQLLLDRGAARCMLYTDLANPVSNHIYAKIGYRRMADWEEHRFIPPARD